MDQGEKYVEAGLALVQLGRWMQRTDPAVNKEGSQYDEDAVLAKLLPEPVGIYVDVGAYHARECSNTWAFYQRGWRGLLIEPLPDCWPNLLIERREDRLCPMAASDVAGVGSLRVNKSISSLQQDWPNDATEAVPCITKPLRDILAMYSGEYDWSMTRLCSIDVEGFEREVLLGIDWATFRPEVFILEYRIYDARGFGKDTSGEWRGILERQGYAKVELPNANPLNQIWKLK